MDGDRRRERVAGALVEVAEVSAIDLFETPADVIDALHGAGRTVICYFSAGNRESWRPDPDDFPEGALGKPLDGLETAPLRFSSLIKHIRLDSWRLACP